jgi:hypothetical protein
MTSIHPRSFVLALATAFIVAAPAAADRPSCEDLLSAREIGQSVEQVAEAFKTTSVRVRACQRVAEHQERLAAQRRHVQAARAQRLVGE